MSSRSTSSRVHASPATIARAAALWGVGMACAFGCAAVLGIEDAECDPDFDAECIGSADVDTGRDPLASAGAAGANDMGAGSAGAGGVAGGGAAGAAVEEPDGPEAIAEGELCPTYCSLVMENCTGDFQQYASLDSCASVCARLVPGEPGDALTNSIYCRLERARLARSTGEPAGYCYSAGPGGGGSCGEDCEGFCDLMTSSCDDLGARSECLSACAEVPALQEPFSTLIHLQAGNSIQCRLFHVSAATLDPANHCIHAAGEAVCVGTPPERALSD